MPVEVARVTNADGSLLLALSGAIDDTADLELAFEHLPAVVTIDLKGIERINSVGMLRWIQALSRIDAKTRLAIDAVPYVMMVQANAVHDLFGRAEIRSCVAPYFCSACQTCQTPVVTRTEVLAAGGDIPQKVCSDCRAVMAFDDLDSYFTVFAKG